MTMIIIIIIIIITPVSSLWGPVRLVTSTAQETSTRPTNLLMMMMICDVMILLICDENPETS